MEDYLQPVSSALRIASIVCCTITSIICLLLSLLTLTNMIQRQSFHYQGKPLWIAAVVIAVVGLATAFIAWRLVRRHVAANGITLLPIWFIQLFGVFMIIGLCLFAYLKGSVLYIVEAVPIFLAMIFVGRHIAKKQREELADNNENDSCDSGNSSL